MNLYFVKAVHPEFEDEDQDLLVRAHHIDLAESYWREHYELSEEHTPISIVLVPVDGPAGAISWSDIT